MLDYTFIFFLLWDFFKQKRLVQQREGDNHLHRHDGDIFDAFSFQIQIPIKLDTLFREKGLQNISTNGESAKDVIFVELLARSPGVGISKTNALS